MSGNNVTHIFMEAMGCKTCNGTDFKIVRKRGEEELKVLCPRCKITLDDLEIKKISKNEDAGDE